MTRYLTPEKAAERVGKSGRTLGRWIEAGLKVQAGLIREDQLLEFDLLMRERRGRPRGAAVSAVVATPTEANREALTALLTAHGFGQIDLVIERVDEGIADGVAFEPREGVAIDLWQMGGWIKHKGCPNNPKLGNDANYENGCSTCETYLLAVADAYLALRHTPQPAQVTEARVEAGGRAVNEAGWTCSGGEHEPNNYDVCDDCKRVADDMARLVLLEAAAAVTPAKPEWGSDRAEPTARGNAEWEVRKALGDYFDSATIEQILVDLRQPVTPEGEKR